jgi:hypothetical protein
MRFAGALLALGAGLATAGEQEVGLTLGALTGRDRDAGAGRIALSAGTALQANYARRLTHFHYVDVMADVHLLASPQQQISSALPSATRDIAVLYLTPGVRFRFVPQRRLSPWAVAGGGYALYEQSTMTVAGNPNGAPRHTNTGALEVGGGADFQVFPGNSRLALRGEARGFYTGNPAFNLPVSGAGQWNVAAGGGIVLRFGR